MKKKICAFGVMGILLISCSSSSEDYAKAASELCNCMSESDYNPEDLENLKVNVGVCLLDAEVDLKNPKMVVELEKNCPEIVEGFEEFVANI